MTTANRADETNSRRRFLTMVGAATLTATAGCTGDAADPDGSNGPDGGNDADGDEAVSCDDIPGTPIPFGPDDRQFPFLFEYPETFEEYNSQINEGDSLIGAQFGHVGSAESASYPVNLAIYQPKAVNSDEESAENWVTSTGLSERLDWTFTYGGEEIEVYENTAFEDPSSSAWRFLLPAQESDGVRGVTVQFQDLRSDDACLEVLAAIAQALLKSLTANPEWPGQSST